MINQKKQDERKIGVNPVVAAVTGAVVGAGIAVAGAVALKDEKNREKIKEVLTNVKNQAINYMEDVQNQAQVEEKIVVGKEKVKKVASSTKVILPHDTKDPIKTAYVNRDTI